MSDVDLPRTLADAGCGYDVAPVHHHPPIDERDGPSRDEDEEVGRVGKSVVARRDPVDHVVRNMVEKDRPVRDPTKHIETIVPPWRRKMDGRRNLRHGLATLLSSASARFA